MRPKMKVEIMQSKKDELILKFDKPDQGMLNLIKAQLWRDAATDIAGFRITHPEVGWAEFTLRTKGQPAKAVWNRAIASLSTQLDEFGKLVKKIK